MALKTILLIIMPIVFSLGIHASEFSISDDVLQEVLKKHGPYGYKRVVVMNKFIKSMKNVDSLEVKLNRVNDFYNKIPYKSDKKNWNTSDYWANPIEFCARYKGDCEDYVIAKYFTLVELGVKPEKLFFTYVTQIKRQQSHMVLTYIEKRGSAPLILDNLNYKILPASSRSDLKYVYSFSARDLYENRQKMVGEKSLSKTQKNGKWIVFLQNIKLDRLGNSS